jgi:hypothetical protein
MCCSERNDQPSFTFTLRPRAFMRNRTAPSERPSR